MLRGEHRSDFEMQGLVTIVKRTFNALYSALNPLQKMPDGLLGSRAQARTKSKIDSDFSKPGPGRYDILVDRLTVGMLTSNYVRPMLKTRLETMKPVFAASNRNLGKTMADLSVAQSECDALARRIGPVLLAMNYGFNMSDWLTANMGQLKEGVNDLMLNLQRFEVKHKALRATGFTNVKVFCTSKHVEVSAFQLS